MASDLSVQPDLFDDRPHSRREMSEIEQFLRPILPVVRFLASLKVTVTLLALSIILVLAGTLAQAEADIWEVVGHYFRCWTTSIELRVFFPKSFFPNMREISPMFALPFPGGFSIGVAMFVNLIAAHLLRFKIQSFGPRLWAGLGVIGAGSLIVFLIVSGNADKASLNESGVDWGSLWFAIKCGLTLVAAVLFAAFAWAVTQQPRRYGQWGSLLAIYLAAMTLAVYVWVGGENAAISAPSMRILWQLAKGGFAATVLLAGCGLAFRKRAGIVLLHAGVGLMMANELVVATLHNEAQMIIREGEGQNYAIDIRKFELAVIEATDDKRTSDETTVVPGDWLWLHRAMPLKIADANLPFNLRVDEVLSNSTLRSVSGGNRTYKKLVDGKLQDRASPANAGAGLNYSADELSTASGTEMNAGPDRPAAYVTLLDKNSGDKLGSYLLSLELRPQSVTLGDKKYEILLRYKRINKPYSVHLNSVTQTNYKGTTKPKDYTSVIRLTDTRPGSESDRDNLRIWMNNPLRYGGDTLYQSGFQPDPETGKNTTTLQVVSNTGWMLPYVACMIVMVGMLAQFLLTLQRFIRRQSTAQDLALMDALAGRISWSDVVGSGSAHDALADADRPPERVTLAEAVKPLRPVVIDRAKYGRPLPVNRDPSVKQSSINLAAEDAGPDASRWLKWAVPAAVVGLVALILISAAMPPSPLANQMNLYEMGRLPLQAHGRIMPFDTLARVSMRVMSQSEDFSEPYLSDSVVGKAGDEKAIQGAIVAVSRDRLSVLDNGGNSVDIPISDSLYVTFNGAKIKASELDVGDSVVVVSDGNAPTAIRSGTTKDRKLPAMRWLMDVIARPKIAEGHRVFKIDNPDVLVVFNFRARASGCYSVAELRPKIDEFNRQVKLASKIPTKERNVFQRKLMDLDSRIKTFTIVAAAFTPMDFPEIPSETEFKQDPDAATAKLMEVKQFFDMIPKFKANLQFGEPASAVPNFAKNDWETFADAVHESYRERIAKGTRSAALTALAEIFDQYAVNQPKEFNAAVDNYQKLLDHEYPHAADLRKTSAEAYFNHARPYFYDIGVYIFALVLAMASFAVWQTGLNRTAFWLLCLAFVIHTASLIFRIYITERAPATNLYSVAIFAGWGCCLMGLVMERIFKFGIGNVVAAVAGCASLLIANGLSNEGDMMPPLQAVLDTQFWLSTHVICVVLGYATTFVAGILGCIYVLEGLFCGVLSDKQRKDLNRVTYGILCFAILFSFFGTVLGGLWADDSWGRFWGWDPKENGALMIVLWNALVLHARWDGIVKERGLALLVIVGNIVVAWSMFGVNELGVGLHSYGLTEGTVAKMLLFMASQLLIISLGLIPKALWAASRGKLPVATAVE